ncbi:hypothetical protein [Helicobacter suis]|uniref:Uncharacterized protein n=1 Tax=Helicobacter suis TaxID=104628 RepID=A0A6J4CZH7_9HELI|nr:hypothetical protein [Helicobacter suis]BCD45886.1 hypothetical protein NHP190020_09250 [Helicobacter suis]BCD48188.1 hypothetical protein NHP194003_13920 [Helicobacter suis]BCD49947.1 hypothetical protein NHP194004_13940 [Helicobacter suis]BCD51710.1 hypothetical protein NHP194022_13810 [Helicobacter suis]BCD69910.1 hypothetical protein SNTW_05550 [Helicobacter suis]
MRKWILLGLCFLSCFLSTLQATQYFFRDFHAKNLEYAIHLKRKLKKEIQACAQLNTLPHLETELDQQIKSFFRDIERASESSQGSRTAYREGHMRATEVEALHESGGGDYESN